MIYITIYISKYFPLLLCIIVCVFRYTIHPNNSLVVHVSRAGDAGAYLCVGIGEGGPVQTFMTLLKLASKSLNTHQYS